MTSLSQQLKLGKIHQKVKPGKESPEVKKRSYTDYLHGEVKSTKTSSEKGKHIRITPPTGRTPDVRIIKSRSKHRNKKPKKKQGADPLKDIFKVQLQLQERESATKSEKKPETKPEPKPEKPKRRSKRDILRSRRSTKRHNHPMKTKGRNVKINQKKISPDDLKRIEDKILSIRNKKPKDIKEALEKDGIKVSGKSTRLLKDIYFYSKVCNINIQHEE